MLGSPKRDPVWFGFLKTREPRVKFRVGFGPDPALVESTKLNSNFEFRNWIPNLSIYIIINGPKIITCELLVLIVQNDLIKKLLKSGFRQTIVVCLCRYVSL